jgi:hypothetical protein
MITQTFLERFMDDSLLMTDEECGRYAKLLSLQYKFGRLDKSVFFMTCKETDRNILEEFICIDNVYYHEVLDKELERVKAYSDSRRKNRMTKRAMSKTKKVYPGKEAPEDWVEPTLKEIQGYCIEQRNGVNAVDFLNFWTTKDWIKGGKHVSNWKALCGEWARNK